VKVLDVFLKSFGSSDDIIDEGSCKWEGAKEPIDLSLYIVRAVLKSHHCNIE